MIPKCEHQENTRDECRLFSLNGNAVSEHQEMPTELDDIRFPALSLQVDQGGTGSAGMYFLRHSIGLCLSVRWDVFHRAINDIKDASTSVTRSVLRRSLMQSSFIFNLNYGPWGSGQWYETKKALLTDFMRKVKHTSPLFLKYFHLVFPDRNVSEAEDCWQSLPLILRSFTDNCKGPLAKVMRWFAWWENFRHYAAEWWPTRMLFEFWLSNSDEYADHDLDADAEFQQSVLNKLSNDDPREEMRKLRMGTGSFRLAYHLLTRQLLVYCRILYEIGSPCWCEQTRLIVNVRNPAEALADFIRKAQGSWQHEVAQILKAGLRNEESLLAFGIRGVGALSAEATEVCLVVVQFCLSLAENRAWSHILGLLPPFSYAEVAGSEPVQQERAVAKMKREWHWLLRVERAARTNRRAQDLVRDIPFTQCPCERLAWLLFERFNFSPQAALGQQYLRALLRIVPDSRIIEELHRKLRECVSGGNGKHFKRDRHTKMRVLTSSHVLNTRMMNEVRVSQLDFVGSYRRPRDELVTVRRHLSAQHRLPKEYSRIFKPGKTDWWSPTPRNSRKMAAAWQWMCHYFQEGLDSDPHVDLDSVWASVLMVSQWFVRRSSDQTLWSAACDIQFIGFLVRHRSRAQCNC